MKKLLLMAVGTATGVAFTFGSSAIATAADLGFSVSGTFGDTVINPYFGERENTIYRTFSGTYSYNTSAPDLEEFELFGLYSLSDFEIEVFGDNSLLVTISPLNGWTGFLTVDPEPEPIPLIGLGFSNSNLGQGFQLNFPGVSNDDSLPTVVLETTFDESPGYYGAHTDGTNDFYLVREGTVTKTSVPEPSSILALSLLGLGMLLKRSVPTNQN